jgi:hypothetical protein
MNLLKTGRDDMKWIKFFSMLVFVLILGFVFSEISYAAEPKVPPGAIRQKQLKPGPTSGYADYQVKRVFVAKRDTPNIPYTGPFYTTGDYNLSCEITYTGRVNTASDPSNDPRRPRLHCIGTGSSAIVAYNVDNSNRIYSTNTRCLAPYESKIFSYYYDDLFFSAGTHTFECFFYQTDLPDLNPDNNTKSMSYEVIKPHKRLKPKR